MSEGRLSREMESREQDVRPPLVWQEPHADLLVASLRETLAALG